MVIFMFFLKFSRYASECKSYDLVMSAARYYWNNIYTSLSKPIERQLLQEPIKSLLSCINKVSKEVFQDVSTLVWFFSRFILKPISRIKTSYISTILRRCYKKSPVFGHALSLSITNSRST